MIVAMLYGVLVPAFGTTDLDDTFHLFMEVAALSTVVWAAWRWRNPLPKHQVIDQALQH